MFRIVQCKRVWAVIISQALRKRVEAEVVIKPMDTQVYSFYKSERIIRKSLKHIKNEDIRRYLCEGCGGWFPFNFGFEV